jgi:hypothetical protein
VLLARPTPSPDCLDWMRLAVLDLANGDNTAYKRDTEEMFKRFAAGNDWRAHEQLAKACLLNPKPFELAKVSALAKSAVTRGGKENGGEWTMFTNGLALYRNGRYDEAIRQLVESRDKPNEGNECPCQFVLAMAHARLKHESQARAEFDRGARIAHADDMSAFKGQWQDWLVSQLLQREAEAVLKSSLK